MKSKITLMLGRDGMGDDATEADFDHWLGYVNEHIDDRCGFEVSVESRDRRDVQSDSIVGSDDVAREVVGEAMQVLWLEWCDGMWIETKS